MRQHHVRRPCAADAIAFIELAHEVDGAGLDGAQYREHAEMIATTLEIQQGAMVDLMRADLALKRRQGRKRPRVLNPSLPPDSRRVRDVLESVRKAKAGQAVPGDAPGAVGGSPGGNEGSSI